MADPTIPDLTVLTAPLTNAVAAVAAKLTELASAIGTTVAKLANAGSATLSPTPVPGSTAVANTTENKTNKGSEEDKNPFGTALLSISNSLGGKFGDLAAKIADVATPALKTLATDAIGVVSPALANMAGSALSLVPGLGTLAETFVNVASQIIELPGKILSAIQPFVEALSPNLLLAFNQQLANLQATIGTAFENVFNILAPVLNTVAGQIQGLMDALRPMIDQVAELFGSALTASVGMFVDIFKSLLPLMQGVMPIVQMIIEQGQAVMKPVIQVFQLLMSVINVVLVPLQALASIVEFVINLFDVLVSAVLTPLIALFQLLMVPINAFLSPLQAIGPILSKVTEGIQAMFNVFSAVIATAVETVTEFFNSLFGVGDLSEVFKTIENAMKQAVSAILVFVGYLAKFFGADSFLDKLIKNLSPKPHAIAAPKDVSFKGIEQITKDIAVSAFSAGGGTEKTQTDYMKDGLDQLKEIRAGRKTLEVFLREQFDRMVQALDPRTPLREKVESWEKNHPTLSGILEATPGGALARWMLG